MDCKNCKYFIPQQPEHLSRCFNRKVWMPFADVARAESPYNGGCGTKGAYFEPAVSQPVTITRVRPYKAYSWMEA